MKKIVDEAYRRTLQLMEAKKDQVWFTVNHVHGHVHGLTSTVPMFRCHDIFLYLSSNPS